MQAQKFVRRCCPACQITGDVEGIVSSGRRAENMTFEELVPYWNGFFKEKVFFSFNRCRSCGLQFAPIFFNEDQLQLLYRQMAPNMDIVPIEALRRTQRGYYEVMAKWRPSKGGFLEVGPDIGLFTEHCIADDLFDEFWLFEPNIEVHRQLEATVATKKYNISVDMLSFAQVPDASVSAATMIHVLDHLVDPIKNLKELREKLTFDAKLVLVTHNERSLMPRLMGSRWPAYCLQHPQVYNYQSLQRLLREAGFKVLEQSKTVNHFPLSFLIKQALWALGFNVTHVPAFGDKLLGLKLGNMITVATPT